MKKRNGFTLVELLAVIVILAIILVIAVPQITKTIKNARMGALGSSAKLIASTAEREKLLAEAQEQTVGTLTCAELAPSETTIGDCVVAFGTGNNADTAYVTLNGKADTSYKDFHICDATKASATVSETACTGTVAVLSGGSQQGGGN